MAHTKHCTFSDHTFFSNDELYECYNCGANVPRKNLTQHSNFHATFSNRKDQTMANVKWCDLGDHAYKADEEGSFSGTGTTTIEGRQVDVSQDICAKHNPMNAAREAARYQLSKDAYKTLTTPIDGE